LLVFETGSQYITQIGLNQEILLILMPLPPQRWDYRHASTYLIRMIFF
jgi:hypothetical protein